MESNVSLVILTIIFVLLIVLLPIYNVFSRQDDMSYNLALRAATNFVDEVRATGKLTYDMYQELIQNLDATNNTYDIKLEAYKIYLVLQDDGTYKEEYIIEYTEDILNVMREDGYTRVYDLDKGERFYVRIKNTNITKADAFLSSIKFFDTESKINIDYGGVILINTIIGE